MRSEKEIIDRVNFLKELEEKEAERISYMHRERDVDFLYIAIIKANTIQNERLTLEWVLGEDEVSA